MSKAQSKLSITALIFCLLVTCSVIGCFCCGFAKLEFDEGITEFNKQLLAFGLGRTLGLLVLIFLISQPVSIFLKRKAPGGIPFKILGFHKKAAIACLALAFMHSMLMTGCGIVIIDTDIEGVIPIIPGLLALLFIWMIVITTKFSSFLGIERPFWLKLHRIGAIAIPLALLHASLVMDWHEFISPAIAALPMVAIAPLAWVITRVQST